MPSTNRFSLWRGVGRVGLPLLLLLGGSCQQKGASPHSWALSDSLRMAYRALLYPYLAGARAARDSISSYRWEIAEKQGDTIYFGISRPARSLYQGRREGVVGRFVPTDTGLAYYEELFWTYRFPEDTIGLVLRDLLEKYWQGEWDTTALLECCVSFPDRQTYYDTRSRRWILRWQL